MEEEGGVDTWNKAKKSTTLLTSTDAAVPLPYADVACSSLLPRRESWPNGTYRFAPGVAPMHYDVTSFIDRSLGPTETATSHYRRMRPVGR